MRYFSKPYQESIVQIYDKTGNEIIGTGVVIAQKYLLTCAHVICDSLQIDYFEAKNTINKHIMINTLKDNLKQQALVLDIVLDETQQTQKPTDIALLLLEKEISIQNYPLIEIEKYNLNCEAFGFDIPEGRWIDFEYKGNNALGWGQLDSKTHDEIDQGFSGSPVWDNENQGIIGLIVAKREGIKSSYMIPSYAILELDNFKKYLDSYIRPRNPYKGLNSFREDDQPFYFGRDEEIDKLIPELSPNSKYNFFSIIGISGVGKTSFINAGLVPKLKNNFKYITICIRPRSNPFREIASGLIEYLEKDKTEQAVKISKIEKSLSQIENITLLRDYFKIILKDTAPIIFIIDQFEELFTNTKENIQSLFLMQLLKVIEDKDLPIKILISIRVDFIEKLLNYPEYTKLLNNDTKHFIGDIESEKLKQIIIKPAQKRNVRFEDGLIERILSEINNEKGQLPLLEFALTKLWEKQKYGVITHKALDELGGVLASIGKYAEDVFSEFITDSEKESVKRIMIQLIHPGLGKEDTRQIATFDHFIDEDRKTITELATKRLIVTGSEENNKQQVEIIHEALISQWRDLKKWIDEYREFRLWQNKLRLLIKDWIDHDKDESYLLRGRQLEEAEEKLKIFKKELEPDQEFIKMSSDLKDIEVVKIKRRKRNTIFGIGSFIVVLFIAIIVILSLKYENQKEKEKTLKNEQIVFEKLNNSLANYWVMLLNVDTADGKLDFLERNDKILTILNGNNFELKEKIEKRLSEYFSKKGTINKVNSTDLDNFDHLYSGLVFRKGKYVSMELEASLQLSAWLWNKKELKSMSILLKTITSDRLPDIFQRYKTIDQKDKKTLSNLTILFDFIVEPTDAKLDQLIGNKYFFAKDKVENEYYNAGFDVLTGYKSLLTYTLTKNDFTKEEWINKFKDILEKIQSTSKVLYYHSIKNSNLYTKEQKKTIENMYLYGIYHLDFNQINNTVYTELNRVLPHFFNKNYSKFIENADLKNAQKELDKILQVQNDNFDALRNQSYLYFLKEEKNKLNKLLEKMEKLFPTKTEYLAKRKKILTYVLNNKNFNTSENIEKYKKEISDYFLNLANYQFKSNNIENAIMNSKLALHHASSDKQKVNIYGNLSWRYLLVKNYSEVIKSAKKALELNNKEIWIYGNLAHGYLLNNQKEKAMNIYMKYKGKKIMSSKRLWEDVVKEDFDIFREHNISSPFFNEIESKLFK